MKFQERAEVLRSRFLDFAKTTAQEAGLKDAGEILTLALEAHGIGQPWENVDYTLARAALNLRQLADRPMIIAEALERVMR